MARRYRYATTVSFGTDGESDYCELDVEVSYEVAWGSPESGNFGPPENYDPGSGDAVECVTVEKVDGKPAPWSRDYGVGTDDDELAQMIAEKLDDEDLIQAAAEAEEASAPDPYSAAKDARMEAGR